MGKTRSLILLALFLFGSVGVESALAQSYRRGYTPPPEEEPFVEYLNGRCRSLYNAMRQGKSSYEVMEGMRREYRRDCQDMEEDARRSYSAARYDARRQKNDDWHDARKQTDAQYRSQRKDMQADQQAATQQSARQSVQSAQCNESRRILATKKMRKDLTPGEVEDLQRFEVNVQARCGR